MRRRSPGAAHRLKLDRPPSVAYYPLKRIAHVKLTRPKDSTAERAPATPSRMAGGEPNHQLVGGMSARLRRRGKARSEYPGYGEIRAGAQDLEWHPLRLGYYRCLP